MPRSKAGGVRRRIVFSWAVSALDGYLQGSSCSRHPDPGGVPMRSWSADTVRILELPVS